MNEATAYAIADLMIADAKLRGIIPGQEMLLYAGDLKAGPITDGYVAMYDDEITYEFVPFDHDKPTDPQRIEWEVIPAQILEAVPVR